MTTWCRHFARNSRIIRVEELWPEIGYDEPGIYEIIPVGKCLARNLRNVKSIPQCHVPPGKGGCRKFEPGEPAFEYNPLARVWFRYLGPLGDPKAEAEARRIEEKQKRT
ncbi:MAG TPA: hypothetical protein ENG33_05950 [Chloroflexi bacterium]|nr:hypothetical protein [Chloroflexota bacterium]